MSLAADIESPTQLPTGERQQNPDPLVTREKPVQRNIAVDAYRGLVMLLMMGEVMRFADVFRAYPQSLFWRVLAFNQTHVEWAGMGLHDMIQPSFAFLVGVAMPYSIASRLRKGQTFTHQLGHAIWRSFLLIALGIFLRSIDKPLTYFTLEDTLTQIGLGYTFAFLLYFCRPRWQWIAFAGILVSYWLAWALYPVPGPGFNFAAVGVPPEWHHNFTGFLAHWNKNSNLGEAFDVWFLNLFPRQSRFLYNEGGYLTLSFIPTLGTMLLGLFAGRWYRESPSKVPVKKFALTGLSLAALAIVLHFVGACPIVKRIWTPGWTLFSGGICFLFLSIFAWIIDVKGFRRWAFPLVVVGLNSMAAYLIAHLCESFIISSLHTHFGDRPFGILGPGLQPLLLGIAVMLAFWLMLFWMYRKKIFIRI
jgi:heparan-alpha-glucosaminide N-acetyltransferase